MINEDTGTGETDEDDDGGGDQGTNDEETDDAEDDGGEADDTDEDEDGGGGQGTDEEDTIDADQRANLEVFLNRKNIQPELSIVGCKLNETHKTSMETVRDILKNSGLTDPQKTEKLQEFFKEDMAKNYTDIHHNDRYNKAPYITVLQVCVIKRENWDRSYERIINAALPPGLGDRIVDFATTLATPSKKRKPADTTEDSKKTLPVTVTTEIKSIDDLFANIPLIIWIWKTSGNLQQKKNKLHAPGRNWVQRNYKITEGPENDACKILLAHIRYCTTNNQDFYFLTAEPRNLNSDLQEQLIKEKAIIDQNRINLNWNNIDSQKIYANYRKIAKSTFQISSN